MKIFHVGEGATTLGILDMRVNDWLQKENPTVISSSQSAVLDSDGVVESVLLTVFYK